MTLFSCGTYQSEITFYADGSGKTNIHYDLGKMIKEMKAAFEGFGKSHGARFCQRYWAMLRIVYPMKSFFRRILWLHGGRILQV